jgi:hypothetical protein
MAEGKWRKVKGNPLQMKNYSKKFLPFTLYLSPYTLPH